MSTYVTRPRVGPDLWDSAQPVTKADPRPASWKASRERVRRPHQHRAPDGIRAGFRGPVGHFDRVSVMDADIRIVHKTERNKRYKTFSNK
jgi:hypothetical protein